MNPYGGSVKIMAIDAPSDVALGLDVVFNVHVKYSFPPGRSYCIFIGVLGVEGQWISRNEDWNTMRYEGSGDKSFSLKMRPYEGPYNYPIYAYYWNVEEGWVMSDTHDFLMTAHAYQAFRSEVVFDIQNDGKVIVTETHQWITHREKTDLRSANWTEYWLVIPGLEAYNIRIKDITFNGEFILNDVIRNKTGTFINFKWSPYEWQGIIEHGQTLGYEITYETSSLLWNEGNLWRIQIINQFAQKPEFAFGKRPPVDPFNMWRYCTISFILPENAKLIEAKSTQLSPIIARKEGREVINFSFTNALPEKYSPYDVKFQQFSSSMFMLNVKSQPIDGVWITYSGDYSGSGTTNFVIGPKNSPFTVTLTAPLTYQDYKFVHWELDGVTVGQSNSLSVEVNEQNPIRVVKAVYRRSLIRTVDLEMHAITDSPVGDIGGKVTVHATFWNQGPDEIPAGSKYSIYIRFVDKGDKNNALNFDSIRALRDGRWEIYSSERKTFIFKDGLSVMGSKTMDFTFDIPGYDIFQTAPVIFTDTLEIIVDSEDFPDTAYYELDYRVMPSYEELFNALLTCAFRLINVEISSKVADPKFKELLLQRSEKVENYMAIQMEIISLGQAASRKDLKGVIESTCKICINIARIVGKDPITLAWSFIEGVITTGRVVGHGLTLIINYMITTIYKLLGNKILGVLISSPVDFIIICKDGRRVGYRDGEILSEVEGSWVKVADHCKLALIPEDNNLVIHLYGTGKGAFSVNIISPNMQAQFTDLSAQENMKAEIYVDTIKDEFIMKKDDNGDGFYDEEINPAIYQLDGELILTKSEKRIRLIFGIPLINFLAMCALTLALIFVTVFLIYRIKRTPSSPPSYEEENKDEEKYKPIWLENHHSSPSTREKREGENMEKEEENTEWL